MQLIHSSVWFLKLEIDILMMLFLFDQNECWNRLLLGRWCLLFWRFRWTFRWAFRWAFRCSLWRCLYWLRRDHFAGHSGPWLCKRSRQFYHRSRQFCRWMCCRFLRCPYGFSDRCFGRFCRFWWCGRRYHFMKCNASVRTMIVIQIEKSHRTIIQICSTFRCTSESFWNTIH